MKILNESEAQALYSYLLTSIDPRDVFLQLLFETGARVSETLPLAACHLVGASLEIAPLKGSALRQVTVSSNLAAKLRHLPHLKWSDALGRPGSTLASRRRGLDRHFRTVAQRLIRRSPNLHTLRHTAFSRLYSATQDLLLVKQWAGHRSVNSTMVYMTYDAQERANEASTILLKRLGQRAE